MSEEVEKIMDKIGVPEGRKRIVEKYTPSDMVNVYQLRINGYSLEQIAEAYGFSRAIINHHIVAVRKSIEISKELISRGMIK